MEPVVITLKPGQALRIELFETDGAFELHYDTPAYPNQLVVKEAEGLEDSSGRTGVLYCEAFMSPIDALDVEAADPDFGDAEDESDEVYCGPPTFAIYSGTRKMWFDCKYHVFVNNRNKNCEFESSHDADQFANHLTRAHGTRAKLEVVRSDYSPSI